MQDSVLFRFVFRYISWGLTSLSDMSWQPVLFVDQNGKTQIKPQTME
jgi:hypothetical protein